HDESQLIKICDKLKDLSGEINHASEIVKSAIDEESEFQKKLKKASLLTEQIKTTLHLPKIDIDFKKNIKNVYWVENLGDKIIKSANPKYSYEIGENNLI